MDHIKNPFNNPHLSPEDASPESISASAKSVFHNNILVNGTSIDVIKARLVEIRERIAKREKKVAAFRVMVGNMGACSFLCPGTGGDLFDTAARLEAEAAMLAHYRLIEEGIERLIEMKNQLSESGR